MNNFSLIACIKGGFGFVTEVADEKGNRYAMKRVIVPIDDAERNRVALNEQVVLSSLPNHPNVVHFYAACQIEMAEKRQRHYCTLMEYCEGNVWDSMVQYKSKGEKFSEMQICAIFRDACLAIHHLHSQMPPIAHRDLKVENLLFGLDGYIKLTDFGSCTTDHGIWTTSRQIKGKEEEISKHTTLAYRSPEQVDLYLLKKVSEKVDVWALGVLLYVLATERTPFCDAMGNVEKLGILSAKFSFPSDWAYSQGLKDFITFLLISDPDLRPSIHDVLSYGAEQKASGALPNWPGLPTGCAIWPSSDPVVASLKRNKSVMKDRSKHPIQQLPTLSVRSSPKQASISVPTSGSTSSLASMKQNDMSETADPAIMTYSSRSQPSLREADTHPATTTTERNHTATVALRSEGDTSTSRTPGGKNVSQGKASSTVRPIPNPRTVTIPPLTRGSADTPQHSHPTSRTDDFRVDGDLLAQDRASSGAREVRSSSRHESARPKPTAAGVRGTLSDKARLVGGSIASIITQAGRSDGEHELLTWIRKATSGKQPGFPKAKYLRYIVVAIWEGVFTVEWLLVKLSQRPWADSALVCCKVLVTLLKVMQQGPPKILSSYIKYVDFIDQVERRWKAFTCRGASETQSSQIRQIKPNSAIMAIFICKFAALIRQKLHFHSFHPEFGAHFTTLAKLTGKETLPSNLTCQSIPGVLTRLLTILGGIESTQTVIFKVCATFDERTENVGSTNPSPEDSFTAQAAILPLIEESYVLFIACLHLLEALSEQQAMGECVVAESVVSSLSEQFNERYRALQYFYDRCQRINFVRSMDCIPNLPIVCPVDVTSPTTSSTKIGSPLPVDRPWDPFEISASDVEVDDSFWKTLIPLPIKSVDDVYNHFAVLESKLIQGDEVENDDGDFDPFCLYNKLPEADDEIHTRDKNKDVSPAISRNSPSSQVIDTTRYAVPEPEVLAKQSPKPQRRGPPQPNKSSPPAEGKTNSSSRRSLQVLIQPPCQAKVPAEVRPLQALSGSSPDAQHKPPPKSSNQPSFKNITKPRSATDNVNQTQISPANESQQNVASSLLKSSIVAGQDNKVLPNFSTFDEFSPAESSVSDGKFASFDAFAPTQVATSAANPDFTSFDAFGPVNFAPPLDVNSTTFDAFAPAKPKAAAINPDFSSFDAFAPAKTSSTATDFPFQNSINNAVKSNQSKVAPIANNSPSAAIDLISFDAYETTPSGFHARDYTNNKNPTKKESTNRSQISQGLHGTNPFDAIAGPAATLAPTASPSASTTQLDAVYCPTLQPWRDGLMQPAADPTLRTALGHCLQSFSSWGLEIGFEALDIDGVIGTGAFAVVYKGKIRSNGVKVAVKKLLSTAGQQLTAKTLKDFVTEVDFMRTMQHRNIVQLTATCSMPICALMEFCDRGNLMAVLQDSSLRRSLTADIASGMAFLHSRNPIVIHRDLKSLNILVTTDWTAKITDFGLSRLSTEAEANNMMTGQIGTFHWMAPEVISGTDYTAKADVYSFAIIAWELLTRQSPYPGMHPMQIVAAVCNTGLRPTLPPDAPPDLRELISQCWSASAQQRPQFSEIYRRLVSIPRGVS